MARGAVFALSAEERRVVDGEEHTHRRLVNSDGGQRLGILKVGDGVANLEALQANHGADVATLHGLCALVADTLKGVQLLDLGLLLGAVAVADGDVHAVAQRAAVDTAHSDAACVVAIVERRDEHLGRTLKMLRRGNHFNNLVEQIVDVAGGSLPVLTHPAVLGRAVDDGEVELVLGGVKVAHQVEHHLIDLLRATVGLVHLVDHHDGLQPDLQCLLQHEARLGHGSLKSVDEEQAAVCHIEHTLNLATKVGVSGSIENINLCAFPVDRYVFRKNRYPSLALQIVGVEHFPAVVLAVTEQFASEHHLVHQGCLTMVNVRNNCDVTNVLHLVYLKIAILMGAKLQKKRLIFVR